MANLRALRQRIRSVENTRKITRAMQMVSGAKLRRLQEEFLGFRPYAERLNSMAGRFLSAFPDFQHPFLATGAAASEAPAALLLVTSDTGLCGTYNDRLVALAEGFLKEHPTHRLITLGKKGNRHFARRGQARLKEILDWSGRFEAGRAKELLAWLTKPFLDQGISSLWIAHARFVSALRFKPVVERLLPVERPAPPALPERLLTEPQPGPLGEELLRRALEATFGEILLSAFTAEHSARMLAMKNATDNASEMIDHLTLLRNKARQAAITKELIEVVSGAEALR
ncbi:MAG: ATP synthase F1 subunit gamma [Candidatus Omnitrophica bacterium]|nr:ATP synthase F1 subunit gamma [Candidatus Omnitrophota bacterium]